VKFWIMSTAGEVVFGVVLAAIGACCLALAMSVQRYALKTPPPVRFLFGSELGQFWVWFCGLVVYWVANGLFAVSLIYAPLALLGAIFTTLLVWNLLFGRLLLDEHITKIKASGAMLIMVGVALIGVATPTVPTDYSVELVESFLKDTEGLVYLFTLVIIVLLSVVAIAIFEKWYPLPKEEEEEELEHLDELELEPTESAVKPGLSLHLHSSRSAVKSGSSLHSLRSADRFSIQSGRQSGSKRRRTRNMNMSVSIVYSLKKKNTQYITNTLMRTNGFRMVQSKSSSRLQSKSLSSPDSGLMVDLTKKFIEQKLENNPDTPPWLEKLMGVVYPGSLGLDEGIGHLAMKAFMALLSTCGDTDDCGAWILWLMIGLWLVSSLATLWWLQTVFRRYDVTQALPIEYGAVMACDALSAIIFYKEVDYMEDWQLAVTVGGLVVIFIGILVGRC